MPTKTLPPGPAAAKAQAKTALRTLKSLSKGKTLILVKRSGKSKGKREFALPAQALPALEKVLGGLASGLEVSIVVTKADLSTQKAAELLGVSRPFLIGMIERGELSSYKVGSHRRLIESEVLEYKAKRSLKRKAALTEMARDAQLHDVGYSS